MIVRGLDQNGDWLFGRGKNDYVSQKSAVAQDSKTRLLSFIGDCFFAITDGIDWLNLLGQKDEVAIALAVNATLLNTQNVTGILETSITVDNNRLITISYKVDTTYGVIDNQFEYDIGS